MNCEEISRHFDYTIAIPENAPLSVRNRFGNVSASGLRAASNITNAQGNVTVRGGVGAQSIENRFGSIEATDLAGDAVVRNANGPIKVERVKGSLQVTNRFGPVRASDVARDVTIRNANGPVEVQDIRGSAALPLHSRRSRRRAFTAHSRSRTQTGRSPYRTSGDAPRSKAPSRRCARRTSVAS